MGQLFKEIRKSLGGLRSRSPYGILYLFVGGDGRGGGGGGSTSPLELSALFPCLERTNNLNVSYVQVEQLNVMQYNLNATKMRVQTVRV